MKALSQLSYYLILFIFFAISISVHECAHALVAYRLGDPTAKNQGRITLNPLKHLDPLGTLLIFLIQFGWAKPTPVNATYFKDRRKGSMLTSLAGPVSNLLLAIVLAFPVVYFSTNANTGLNRTLAYILGIGFTLNVTLAIFNMIPIAPLDGSKILSYFLPSKVYYKLLEYEYYIMIGFVLLMLFGILSPVLRFLVGLVSSGIIYIVAPIVRLIF
jgi:Zn-dependent protease